MTGSIADSIAGSTVVAIACVGGFTLAALIFWVYLPIIKQEMNRDKDA